MERALARIEAIPPGGTPIGTSGDGSHPHRSTFFGALHALHDFLHFSSMKVGFLEHSP